MRDEIVAKLQTCFEGFKHPPVSEQAVIYTLVELRKLLDRSASDRGCFLRIRLFSNWAVHHELDRDTPARDSLEKAIQVQFPGRTMDGACVDDFIVESLRKELESVSSNLDLPAVFGHARQSWHSWASSLKCVLSEQPLIWSSSFRDRTDICTARYEVGSGRVILRFSTRDPGHAVVG